MERCLNAAPELEPGREVNLLVGYEVQASGKAAGVSVSGDGPERALACVRGVIVALAFPKFEGAGVNSSFPLRYRRAVRPEQ